MRLVDAKSWDGAIRHYAAADVMERHSGGWMGHPLCSRQFLTFDQGAINFSYPGVGNAPTITNLPLCKRCEKKSTELMA